MNSTTLELGLLTLFLINLKEARMDEKLIEIHESLERLHSIKTKWKREVGSCSSKSLQCRATPVLICRHM